MTLLSRQRQLLMESHEAVKAAFKKKSPKELADEIGVSLSLLYKWSQPVGEAQSGAINPLDRVMELDEACEDHEILHWLCSNAGGYFIKDPGEYSKKYRFMPATTEIVQQFAELLGEITDAAVDNKISDGEAEAIRNLWNRLKSHTEGFVTACEQGNFAQIRQEALGQK